MGNSDYTVVASAACKIVPCPGHSKTRSEAVFLVPRRKSVVGSVAYCIRNLASQLVHSRAVAAEDIGHMMVKCYQAPGIIAPFDHFRMVLGLLFPAGDGGVDV